MSRAGFSLIEALVALAIASVSLLAIFGLQQQMTKAQRQLEATLDKSRLERDAIESIQNLNPEANPNGTFQAGSDLKVTWISAPISAEKPSISFPNSPGPLQVRLYRITMRLFDAKGRPIGSYQFDRVGWRTVLTNSADIY